MVGQPEQPVYDPTVYQYEITDPVQGAVGGIANLPLLNLADRTAWLKQQLDALINGSLIPPTVAPLNGPAFTGSTTAPNVAPGDNSTLIANTNFIQTAKAGLAVVNVGGNVNVTLGQSQWGVGILVFQGVLTGNISVIFPNRTGIWQVSNLTTGPFTLVCQTAAGSGVSVTQTTPQRGIWCDGVSIWPQESVQLPRVPRSGSFGPAGSLGGVGTTNWTVPAEVTRVRMRLWGGGAGGAGSVVGQGGGGGGSGGYAEGIYPVAPGLVIQVIVGAGGVGGAIGSPGSAGGFSVVTNYLQASGGTGGIAVAPWNGGGGGTPALGNVLNIIGGHGGGGVSGTNGIGGPGGSAPMGGIGDASSAGATGGGATSPGGGGAGFGGQSAGFGSAGAAGIVLFDW